MWSFGLRKEKGAQVGIGKQGRNRVRVCKVVGSPVVGTTGRWLSMAAVCRGCHKGKRWGQKGDSLKKPGCEM